MSNYYVSIRNNSSAFWSQVLRKIISIDRGCGPAEYQVMAVTVIIVSK